MVGWINLMNPSIEAALEKYQDYPIVKGFRHILQGEVRGFMLQPEFIDGLKALAKNNYTYDLLIYHGASSDFSRGIESLLPPTWRCRVTA